MSFLIVGFVVAAGVYLAACGFLYFKQGDFIFPRVVNDAGLANQWGSRKIHIPAGDVTIEGWLAENTEVNNDLTVLYFGGNAEDVLYAASRAKELQARRFLATNYRGYGHTPGEPTEANLFHDALAVYDTVTKRPGITDENLIVMGRSLGSGVATYVAAHRRVRSAVLITPYDSIAAVAQGQFPLFPVGLLLRHRFPSAALARTIRVPVLVIAAERDEVVPAIHTARLFAAWAGPKQLVTLGGVGHNDIDQEIHYYARINEFMTSTKTTGVA